MNPTRVRMVAEARSNLSQSEATMTANRAKFNEENLVLIEEIKARKEAVEAAEQELKDHALAYFNALTPEERAEKGAKTAILGVAIVEKKTIDYDDEKALDFAKTNPAFIKPESLDKSAFETYMKAAAADQRPAWVTLGTELDVKFDGDMAKTLANAASVPQEANA